MDFHLILALMFVVAGCSIFLGYAAGYAAGKETRARKRHEKGEHA